MISCKIFLANTNKDESVIISSKIRQCTAELSACMDRNLLLRFNDGIILVVHSEVLAYYSVRFFHNYRLNRYHVKIINDADIARNLIQFHYTGILQILFLEIEKYFLIASQLAFDIALEALSQLLEKFSHQNSYHAIICANIACESNNHVATPCVKSIIYCAATFLQESINSDSYKIYASPNAAYRILQVLALFIDWKKTLQLALEWITYAECRYCYADFIFDAIVFKASDELIRIVKKEIDCLPRKVGEVLAKRCEHIIYRYLTYDENNIERRNQAKRLVFSTEVNTSTSVRSFARNKVKTSSIKAQEDTQSSNDNTQRTHTSNSNEMISHERLLKRSQANSSQLLTMKNKKFSRESKISHKSINGQNSRIFDKLQKSLNQSGLLLSCFDEVPNILPDSINIKHSREKQQPEMVQRQTIAEQKIINKMKYLNKFGFVADAKLSDNAITV
ncbi:Zinc finger and BTB domain-containing protein [Dirofilaria immitis]